MARWLSLPSMICARNARYCLSSAPIRRGREKRGATTTSDLQIVDCRLQITKLNLQSAICNLQWLPGVCLWRLATGAGPDLIQLSKDFVGQTDLQRVRAAGELLNRWGAHDRRCHRRVAQQPGQRHVGRLLAQLAAERLVCLQLLAV